MTGQPPLPPACLRPPVNSSAAEGSVVFRGAWAGWRQQAQARLAESRSRCSAWPSPDVGVGWAGVLVSTFPAEPSEGRGTPRMAGPGVGWGALQGRVSTTLDTQNAFRKAARFFSRGAEGRSPIQTKQSFCLDGELLWEGRGAGALQPVLGPGAQALRITEAGLSLGRAAERGWVVCLNRWALLPAFQLGCLRVCLVDV